MATAESRPGLKDRILDKLFPRVFPPDLRREASNVTEEYKKVLKGEITDPEETERIRRRYNEWFQSVRDHVKKL